MSAMLCVPLFALFAAGVTISADSLRSVFTEPVGLGIVLGLLFGKTVGILGGTFLTARFTRAELNEDLAWSDVAGVAVLAGIGFTVSLLIGELAFEVEDTVELAKTAVLVGSLLAALVASAVLGRRNAVYRRIDEDNSRDGDDGVPDSHQGGAAEHGA
jgi:NhaA family Na+:H+ antiporter